MKTQPDLLLHPNLPAPLHGLAPRLLKGKEWWDIERQKAYAMNDYHCFACGVHKSQARIHQWLEAHEFYDIDYEKGRMELNHIVALCHLCHNFIHSGRLAGIYLAGASSENFVSSVLKHGANVLRVANLPMNGHALTAAEVTGVSYPILSIHAYEFGIKEHPESSVEWSDWRLVIDGVEYAPLWKNETEHDEHYSTVDANP